MSSRANPHSLSLEFDVRAVLILVLPFLTFNTVGSKLSAR